MVRDVRQLLLVYTLEAHFDQISMKFCQNVNLYTIKVKFETGAFWVKILQGRILDKPCVPVREQCFKPVFINVLSECLSP